MAQVIVTNSRFWLRSRSQSREIEPHVRLCAEHGSCLRFSLPFPLPLPPCTRVHTVSLEKKKKKKEYPLVYVCSQMSNAAILIRFIFIASQVHVSAEYSPHP